MRKSLFALAFLPALGSLPVPALAQQIAGVHAQPERTDINQPVRVLIDLDVGSSPPGCGLKLELGDGSVRYLRADDRTIPMMLSYSYARPGEYTVKAQGAAYVRGLRTALPCNGPAHTTVVNVVDVEGERAAAAQQAELQARAQREREENARTVRLEQERRQREAAERRAQQEERERAQKLREAEAQRLDAERRQRELASRDAELQRRERELRAREEALAAQEKGIVAAQEKESRREASSKTRRPAAAAPASTGSSQPAPAPAPAAKTEPPRTHGTLDAF